MKKYLLAGLLMATLLTASVRPSYAILDKTRFVADVGMAFFAFHHWVYTPFRQGAFGGGAPGRTKALVKGGVALLFAVNRVKAASNIAHHSKSPMLQRLAGAVDAMSTGFATVGQRLKAGQFNPKDLMGLNGTVNSVGSGAAAAGAPIKDVKVAIPGV